jgi:hypothetical protein
MPTCIWCLTVGAPSSIEHIIPEALGCPKDFVLTGGIVCKSCNNALAHLDRAVIDDFEMIAYLANVPRKGGRPALARSRGNLIATRGRSGPEISINMDPKTTLAHDGTTLGAFGKSRRNANATLTKDGSLGRISFANTIGEDPKFVRGITKIAFSSFTYFIGADTALHESFGAVRAYVRDGVGQRPILMVASDDSAYKNEAWPPYKSETGDYYVTFRLAAAEFLVDLSPNLSLSSFFSEELNRKNIQNWTWLPPGGSN